jgi:hypothetical protein
MSVDWLDKFGQRKKSINQIIKILSDKEFCYLGRSVFQDFLYLPLHVEVITITFPSQTELSTCTVWRHRREAQDARLQHFATVATRNHIAYCDKSLSRFRRTPLSPSCWRRRKLFVRNIGKYLPHYNTIHATTTRNNTYLNKNYPLINADVSWHTVNNTVNNAINAYPATTVTN